MQGRIVRAVAGEYLVETETGALACRPRGSFRLRGITPLVGDAAELERDGDRGVITALAPRRNAFVRPPVANIDVMVIVASAAIPVTEPFLIDRMAAIAHVNGCAPVICVNKNDLSPAGPLAEIYTRAGYPVFTVSAATGEGIGALTRGLCGKVSALTGNSGAGKTSLLNAMGLSLLTGDVSRKLGRGRHTTRHTELHRLKGGAMIVDTPGFSSFDPGQMALDNREDIEAAFPELAPYLGRCRFMDCAHLREPGCAVRDAVAAGEIGASRYRSYARLTGDARERRAREYK